MPLDDFPADTASPAYNEAFLSHENDFDMPFASVTSKADGHEATFHIMSDALKIQGVRMSVSAYLEQTLADMLGCMLLTPKLADLLWLQRTVTLPPMTRPITSKLADMIDNSQKMDRLVGGQTGIIQTVGKHWVLSNLLAAHPGRAINYGWGLDGSFGGSRWAPCFSDPQNPHCRVIQDPGWAHDMRHIDYSQTCVLVKRDCIIDGQKKDLADVLQDKALCGLASHEGPLKVLRQPLVPVTACKLPDIVGGMAMDCAPPVKEEALQEARIWPWVVGGVVVAGLSAYAWMTRGRR